MIFSQKTISKYSLLCCASLSIMCTAIISPALTMIKAEFRYYPNAEMLVKLAATAPNIFIAIFSPLFGLIPSRFSKKYILAISLLLYAVSGTSVYFLGDLRLIIITRCFLGIFLAGLLTVSLELISSTFSGHERNKILAAQTTVMSIGSIVFTLLSGILSDINWRYSFLLYASVIIILPLILIYVDKFSLKNIDVHDKNTPLTGFAKIFGNNLPFMICLISLINMMCFYMIPIQIPFLLKQLNSQITAKAISIVITAEVVSSAIFATKYKRIKKNRSFESICAVSFGIMSIAYIMMSYAKTYNSILLCSAIYGIGMALMMPNNAVWMVHSSYKNRGFWLGMLTTAIYSGKFLSPVITDIIMRYCDIATSYRFIAVFMLFLGIIVSTFGGGIRRLK